MGRAKWERREDWVVVKRVAAPMIQDRPKLSLARMELVVYASGEKC